ncbi:hypothetical protein [Kitasatospora sp. NPDC056181]|uniref:hypothetical protein n=1 Tax=Kitasatospora sp. NPDC056181 TaxID=3345737 RepID=UPI0035E2C6E1
MSLFRLPAGQTVQPHRGPLADLGRSVERGLETVRARQLLPVNGQAAGIGALRRTR